MNNAALKALLSKLLYAVLVIACIAGLLWLIGVLIAPLPSIALLVVAVVLVIATVIYMLP